MYANMCYINSECGIIIYSVLQKSYVIQIRNDLLTEEQ